MGRERSPLPPDCTGRDRLSHPFDAAGRSSYGKGGSLPVTMVSEIHRYPSRPPGFEEPLFATRESRRAVAEHLARAPWLSRGSELRRGSGQAVHSREEPAHVLRRADGRVYLIRRCGNGRRKGSLRERRVVKVLE